MDFVCSRVRVVSRTVFKYGFSDYMLIKLIALGANEIPYFQIVVISQVSGKTRLNVFCTG